MSNVLVYLVHKLHCIPILACTYDEYTLTCPATCVHAVYGISLIQGIKTIVACITKPIVCLPLYNATTVSVHIIVTTDCMDMPNRALEFKGAPFDKIQLSMNNIYTLVFFSII